MLCTNSTYFRSALKGDFLEANAQRLELPEASPATFKRFQLWIYTDSILNGGQSCKDILDDELMNLYMFGEVRGIPYLQNHITNILIDRHKAVNKIPLYSFMKVYDQLPISSPMRKLAVHMIAHRADLRDPCWHNEGAKEAYTQSFLIDLFVALYDRVTDKRSRITDFAGIRSQYYVPVPEDTATKF